MNEFKRWTDKPNNWPTGERVFRRKRGFWGWLTGNTETGIIGNYQYASASTVVPIHWDNGETTHEWLYEIRGG